MYFKNIRLQEGIDTKFIANYLANNATPIDTALETAASSSEDQKAGKDAIALQHNAYMYNGHVFKVVSPERIIIGGNSHLGNEYAIFLFETMFFADFLKRIIGR